jgi:ABC-2 type transport system permease protein
VRHRTGGQWLDEVALEVGRERGGDGVGRHGGEWLDANDVACHRQADHLRAEQAGSDLRVVDPERLDDTRQNLAADQVAHHPRRLRLGSGGADQAGHPSTAFRILEYPEKEASDAFADLRPVAGEHLGDRDGGIEGWREHFDEQSLLGAEEVGDQLLVDGGCRRSRPQRRAIVATLGEQPRGGVVMSLGATLATALRVAGQLRHDRRTVALVLVVPSALLALLWYLFDNQPETFARIGTPMVGVFPLIMMFLITSIAMLRERTTGTLERLMSMPLAKLDLLFGYGLAFALVGAVQASVTAAVAFGALDIETDGPIWAVVALAISNAVLGMALGLFVSAFATTEFLAVQFMPVFVLPSCYSPGSLSRASGCPTCSSASPTSCLSPTRTKGWRRSPPTTSTAVSGSTS